MKRKTFLISIVLLLVLDACQTATPTPLASTSMPPGQTETRVAATIYAGQTSTAEAEYAKQATLTAAVPSPTNTPKATPTPNKFHFVLPASACWMNSEVNVHTGQTVMIRASGIANTWGGRDISNGDPNGQTRNMCGAIQCPVQGESYGALIGRVGDGESFFVGTSLDLTATTDGQLYFTINDWECNDNSGNFDIVITFP